MFNPSHFSFENLDETTAPKYKIFTFFQWLFSHEGKPFRAWHVLVNYSLIIDYVCLILNFFGSLVQLLNEAKKISSLNTLTIHTYRPETSRLSLLSFKFRVFLQFRKIDLTKILYFHFCRKLPPSHKNINEK